MEQGQEFGILVLYKKELQFVKLFFRRKNVNIATNVKIVNGVKIQNNVSVYEGVELENYVFCGPSMVFTYDLPLRSKYPKGRNAYKPTKVKYGASIGENAAIFCEIRLVTGQW